MKKLEIKANIQEIINSFTRESRPTEKWRTSKFCVNPSPVYISDNMTAKMHGVPAISTTCFCNENCIKRFKSGCGVCSHCFAVGTQNQYTNLVRCLGENEFLKYRKLEDSEVPIFCNVQIVRFEAFGDLATPLQFYNYHLIAKKNKSTRFALWTKNPWIVEQAYKEFGIGKLNNLTLVCSSFELNKEIPLPELFDKTFTVYELDAIDSKQINCGGRCCATCQRCYKRSTGASVKEYLK